MVRQTECSQFADLRFGEAMAGWRKDKDALDVHRAKLLDGLRERGYPDAFADRLFRQIEGFGEYGFPESHAASFALLAYASA